MPNYFSVKNAPLFVSVLVLIPVAIIYGFNISNFWTVYLGIDLNNINLQNVIKSIMGVYLFFAFFFGVAIFYPKYWYSAMCGNALLMGGLAFGRIVSIVNDGLPNNFYIIGALLEAALAFFCIFILRKYKVK